MPKKRTHFSTFKKLLNIKRTELEDKMFDVRKRAMYSEAKSKLKLMKEYRNFCSKHGYSLDEKHLPAFFNSESFCKIIVESFKKSNEKSKKH
jgi:hypothetical protein